MDMNIKDAYVENLRKSNFKITPQRLEVISFLETGNYNHFTAEDVYSNVREKEPTITLATVYNILKALKESGNINSFEVNGKTWFETNVQFHGNLVCDQCGSIMDIEVEPEKFMELSSRGSYRITAANLVMRGLCPECNKHEKLLNH